MSHAAAQPAFNTVRTGSGTAFVPGAGGGLNVYVFVSPECPICQGYALTMRKLVKQFAAKHVNFYAVVPGTTFSKQEVMQYKKDYQVPFTILYDPKYQLTDFFKATVTPEAFVMFAKGKVLYSGRIDNWAYAPGKKRSVVTTHELEDALTAITGGGTVKVTQTKAIGCYIEK